MRSNFHKIFGSSQNSFIIWHQRESYFRLDWHYHPELEFHHVIKGQGVRFIGDNVSRFPESELILLGSNLVKPSIEYKVALNRIMELFRRYYF
ncbi:MAG: hypothetical protein ACR2KZ_13155 [Segetibacter sp.]